MNENELPLGGCLYCLVGGQPVPNLLAALQVRPSRVVLLHTKESRIEAERTRATIASSRLSPVPSIVLREVDAYQSSSVFEQLSGLAEEDVVSLTSGTKPMLIGAISGLLVQGKGTGIYHNPVAHQFLRYQSYELPPVPVTVHMSVEQALGLAGREITAQSEMSDEITTLAVVLAQKRLRSALLRRIGGDAALELRLRNSLASAGVSRTLIDRMLREIAAGIGGWKAFAEGFWLEFATAASLPRASHVSAGFDEVRVGVKVKPRDPGAAGENEYDVLATRGTELYFFSCKDRKPEMEFLHEVVARGRELGLLCRKFLVNPDRPHSPAFCARAREHDIRLIGSLNELRTLASKPLTAAAVR